MKKFLKVALCLCFMLVSIFALVGCKTKDLDSIEFKYNEATGYVQYKTDSDDWTNIISKEKLMEYLGDDLKGDKVDFQVTSTHIQWKYEGETTWRDLIALSDLDAVNVCTIIYDFNIPNLKNDNANFYSAIENGLFDKTSFTRKLTQKNSNGDVSVKYSSQIVKGNYFELYDFDEIGLSDYFDGWYYKGVKVNALNVVASDVELTAKWRENVADMLATSYSSVGYNKYATINEDLMTCEWVGLKQHSQSAVIPQLTLINDKFYKVSSVTTNMLLENSNYIGDIEFLTLCSEGIVEQVFSSGLYTNKLLYGNTSYEDSNHTYVGNYIFTSGFVYVADYENNTCEVVYQDAYIAKMTYVNYNFTDFSIDRNGERVLKLTAIKPLVVYFESKLDTYSDPKAKTRTVILGENLESVGLFLHHYSSSDVVINLFFMNEQVKNDHLAAIKGTGNATFNVYVYSETPQIGAWHYDAGKPVVWTVE